MNLHQEIEKIIWKHYNPDRSMNGEEATEEIISLIYKMSILETPAWTLKQIRPKVWELLEEIDRLIKVSEK